jgi:hypothetical protein
MVEKIDLTIVVPVYNSAIGTIPQKPNTVTMKMLPNRNHCAQN